MDQTASTARVRTHELELAHRTREQSPDYAAEQILAHYARVASVALAGLQTVRARRGRCTPGVTDPGHDLILHCLNVIREDHAHSIGAEPAWPQALLPEIK
jgi:hypothetical protein